MNNGDRCYLYKKIQLQTNNNYQMWDQEMSIRCCPSNHRMELKGVSLDQRWDHISIQSNLMAVTILGKSLKPIKSMESYLYLSKLLIHNNTFQFYFRLILQNQQFAAYLELNFLIQSQEIKQITLQLAIEKHT